VHTRLRGSGITIAQIVQIGATAAAKSAPKEAYTITTTHVHLFGPKRLECSVNARKIPMND
jgi:hypothetical protein